MTDTTLHELCKGYGALLAQSKTPHDVAGKRGGRQGAAVASPRGRGVQEQLRQPAAAPRGRDDAGLGVVKLLVDTYPDAIRLQNDNRMTPLDLATGGGGGGGDGGGTTPRESQSDAVLAMLEGRPLPPELSLRQKAKRYMERADDLERKPRD
ncbi:hypothetical protein ACHAW5_003223 [Stephanodiscus triporus]|uniref:Uncharacterized protein n=1 Tax=Stephanodiscus triporus TaxID=2934178 RepID=A0ABD3QWG6_9STRA